MDDRTKRKVSVGRRQSILLVDKNFKVKYILIFIAETYSSPHDKHRSSVPRPVKLCLVQKIFPF